MTAPAPRIGVIGLGYVGLPLAVVFAEAGVPVLGLDSSVPRVAQVNAGESYIEDVPSPRLAPLVEQGLIQATTSWDGMGDVEAVIICLPTPLDEHREPDLSAVLGATETLAGHLTKGQLVVLESTTYPGTTREELAPLLEASGLIAGEDFHLAFSPERVDPGREDWTTRSTPKVVGGLTPLCTDKVVAVYGLAFDSLVPVSSPEVAEMTKILENVFRSVNIALVNETAMLCDRMGVDVWEVIDAAATKPFGYMPFRPGPGLGGHCIPIDPFYLTWKAKEVGRITRFIELAGEINTAMPHYVLERTQSALNDDCKSIKGSKVLVIGVAYKKNIDDSRESPSAEIIELLRDKGAEVTYHDPHIPSYPSMRKYRIDLKSVELNEANLKASDCVLILTDHDAVDYTNLAKNAKLVVDTRNAMATVPAGTGKARVVKA
jgi:UDP-N-acetyl-D-glucosamine dehydrogenase